MKLFWICASVALILLAGFFATLIWSFRQAFYWPTAKKTVDPHRFLGEEKDLFCKEPMLALVDELDARPFEQVFIRSHDGLRLAARLYVEENTDTVEILFHGWRGSALRDGCGGSRMARDAGHTLLLVDQRAHGLSDGNVLSFGILEKYDCLGWARYAVERFGPDVKILLKGVSMGASTVLMAAGLDLPPQVRGILADCSYSSPEAIIRKVCRVDLGIPDRIGYPLVRLSARLFGGFSLQDGGAVEAVKHATVPILIAHGTEDHFVPFSMAEEIYRACTAEKAFVRIKDAGHGLSFFYDRPLYEKLVTDFQNKILSD